MDNTRITIKSLTSFNAMLTPKIITFIYVVGLGVLLATSVITILNGELGGGLLMLFAGGVGWRIWCELLIVLFKINENIQRIADRGTDIRA